MDMLAELADRVDRDPASAARDAVECAERASDAGDWTSASRAHAIRGRALRALGEIALAERALRDAIAAAARQDDPDVEADVRLALAGVLSAAGRHDDAFAELDVAERLASPPLRRRVGVQCAAVLLDVGRYDEALRRYADLIPGLRADGPTITLARVYNNRAVIRAELGELDDAAADYEEAAALFRAEGNEFLALKVIENLGCVAANLGDVTRALQLFDEVAGGMAELGHDASAPILARADALLLAGLTTEAMEFASEAARRLDAAGSGLSAAKAWLVVAQAALHERQPHAALAAAEAAASTFDAGGAEGWARACQVEMLRARADLGEAHAADIAIAERLADGFAGAGDPRGELHAACIGATIAASIGDAPTANQLLTRAVGLRGTVSTVDAVLAVSLSVIAVGLSCGDLDAARHALDEMLTDGRAGDADGMTTIRRHGLAQLVARVAHAEPDQLAALSWIERERRCMSSTAPHKRHADGARFARLRAISADLRIAEREGTATDELRREHAALERALHEERLRHRPAETGPAPTVFDLETLDEALGRAAAVTIALTDDHAFALVVDGGHVRRVELGTAEALRDATGVAARSLRGLATAIAGSTAGVDARRQAFAAATSSLEAMLAPAFALDAEHVVLTLPAELHELPWAALSAMRERSFVIAPSLAWWTRASQRPAPLHPSVAIIAGPRLEHADTEAESVASAHAGASVIRGRAATAGATLSALANHDVVHVVAHGRFRHDNPRWSTIELADGPLPVYEIESLDRVPSMIVIATCESAVTGGRPGTQAYGIAAALLALGARTVVASIGALPDTEATITTMHDLHHALRDGVGAADALATMRRNGADVTASSLVTLGVGDR